MIYLSKGIVQKNSTEQLLQVSRCGESFRLTGIDAALWLNGRYGFAGADGAEQERALHRLNKMGLVETEQENTDTARYRIMTRCVCCPAAFKKPEPFMTDIEKNLLCWLRNAGIRLSAAELVFLQEHHIKPEPCLLYTDNRQALIEAIYMQDTIADNLLENLMEKAACRNHVIETLQKLLKKKKILVL